MKKEPFQTVAELTAEQANAGFEARILAGRYASRGITPKKFSGAMPSPMELAALAAALARTTSENTEKLCAVALNLWFTSQETIALQQQCNEDYQQLKAAEKPLPEPPENQEWPMGRDVFCRLIFPDIDNTADRANDLKKSLAYLCQSERQGRDLPAPTQDEIKKYVDEKFLNLNTEKIKDAMRFRFLRDAILTMYKKWKPRAHSEQKSLNAQKSWGDCDAKTQKTPQYQEYKAVCVNLNRKTSFRGFKKWLKNKSKPSAPETRLTKKILQLT